MDQLEKIRQNGSKESYSLKISKDAKFGRDLLKINEYSAPQSRRILEMFVWWGTKFAPTHPRPPRLTKQKSVVTL